jgi:hypothetical protein
MNTFISTFSVKISTYLLLVVILLSSSCKDVSSPTDDTTMKTLEEENLILKETIETQAQEINSYFESFNKIEDNLSLIRLKEKGIVDRTRSIEDGKDMEAYVMDEVNFIYQLMEENQQIIRSLEEKLKSSNLNINEFEKTIARLNQEIEKRDKRILELEEQLESINISIGIIYEAYMEQKQLSSYQDTELHKAYFAFGSKSELSEKNIITKEGGFIGIGRAKKLSDDFDENYFKEIDIRMTKSIPLHAKKAEIITTHPENSYKLISKNGQVEKLEIKDPDEFWKVSKYLVIVVK